MFVVVLFALSAMRELARRSASRVAACQYPDAEAHVAARQRTNLPIGAPVTLNDGDRFDDFTRYNLRLRRRCRRTAATFRTHCSMNGF